MRSARGLGGLRIALGAIGVAVAVYGGWLLVSRQDLAQLRSVGTWLVGGLLLHDVAIAVVALVVGALLGRLASAPRAPAVVGAVVLGSVTLAAVPVLGRFGAKADNPSLLDRDYAAGWAALAALVVVGVVTSALVRARSGSRSGRRRPRHRGGPHLP